MGRLRSFLAAGLRLVGADRLAETIDSGDIVIMLGESPWIPTAAFLSGTMEEALEAATYSYACITANAEAMAELPGIVQLAGSPGGDEWVKDRERSHELNGLLRRPFGAARGPEGEPVPKWSWAQLMETTAIQLYITGDSYWVKAPIRGGRGIGAVYLLPNPKNVQVELAKSGYPKRYIAYIQGYREEYGPDEIVHIMHSTTGSFGSGLSPLKAARKPIEIDQVTVNRQLANLKNRISPGMVISVEGAWGIKGKQREETEKYLKEQYQKAEKDGMPLVMGRGAKLLASPQTPRALTIFDTRRYSRDEMVAIYGTPPPMVGIYEAATLQNFSTARSIWWMGTLFPMLRRICGAINRQLVAPTFGEEVRIWYDLGGSDIGLQLMQDRIATAQGLVNLGYPTNMAAAHVGLGMPHVPELDRPNVNFIVAGREEPAPTEPEKEPKPAGEGDEEGAASGEEQAAGRQPRSIQASGVLGV